MKRARIFFLFLFILPLVNSCKKDEPDTETTSATDNSICEGEFTRIFPHVNSIAVGDSGVQKNILDIPVPLGGCPDSWTDSADVANGFPVTLWMTFGADNDGDSIYESPCTGTDNKQRRGVIRAVFSSPWHQPGSRVIMNLQNYYVASGNTEIRYEGTITVSRGADSFVQTVTNGKASKGSDWSISWNSTRTVSTVLGDSANPNDDVVVMKGSADGTDRNGRKFSVEIDDNNPLLREMKCPYIVKGTQTVRLEGKKDRIIDYGDGSCDNKATLNIGGNSFEFTLR